jgi:ABC-type Na+ efflux pump permease subunit
MTFLPIVERELRVAARKWVTYWTRVVIGLLAIVIGLCIFIAHFGEPEKSIGPRIFLGLSIAGICYCLFAGRRSTVDCLSGEKRDGTLGLLFLTDLKGHDVVLGKLAATSLNGFFGLLALFPVMAVTMLMGGISSGQFWRMSLVLVVTFLFSLSIGIYASAVHRTLNKATATNLLLLLFFAVFIPLCALIMLLVFPPLRALAPTPGINSYILWPFFYSSPIFAFVTSFDSLYRFHPANFWYSVGAIHALTWLLVYRAGCIVPNSWQERLTPPPQIAPRRVLQRAISFGEAAKRAAHRKKLLDANAFYWLASRDRRKPAYAWIFLFCALAWWGWGAISSGAFWFDIDVKIATVLLLNSSFKLWIALEAGNQLAEDKKCGSLELLLSSPLTVGDIIRGQFLALRRQFLGPLIAVAAFELLFLCMNPSGMPDYNHPRLFISVVAGLLMLATDVLTISLVAMHQALAARSAAFAGSTTILRVLILPWFFIGITAYGAFLWTAMAGLEGPGWEFFLFIWLAFGLLTDAVFSLLAWRQLRNNFRTLAAGRFSPAQSSHSA